MAGSAHLRKEWVNSGSLNLQKTKYRKNNSFLHTPSSNQRLLEWFCCLVASHQRCARNKAPNPGLLGIILLKGRIPSQRIPPVSRSPKVLAKVLFWGFRLITTLTEDPLLFGPLQSHLYAVPKFTTHCVFPERIHLTWPLQGTATWVRNFPAVTPLLTLRQTRRVAAGPGTRLNLAKEEL